MLQHRVINGESRIFANEAGNDLWIRDCVFPGKTNGYFVEAGAADGISGSSCFILERHLGWTGICVEPNSLFFPKLQQTRPNSKHEFVCLAAEAGVIRFVESKDPYLSGVRDVLERFKSSGDHVIAGGNEVERTAVPLVELLRKHGAPQMIDYAAFDLEGSELEVLGSFPFGEYGFRALSLECDGAIWDGITKVLTANGYREVKNPFNTEQPWERYWLHESTPELAVGENPAPKTGE